ncbi:MAG TPA: hypothetical protein V6C78_07550 [Crinalium sp.]
MSISVFNAAPPDVKTSASLSMQLGGGEFASLQLRVLPARRVRKTRNWLQNKNYCLHPKQN